MKCIVIVATLLLSFVVFGEGRGRSESLAQIFNKIPRLSFTGCNGLDQTNFFGDDDTAEFILSRRLAFHRLQDGNRNHVFTSQSSTGTPGLYLTGDKVWTAHSSRRYPIFGTETSE